MDQKRRMRVKKVVLIAGIGRQKVVYFAKLLIESGYKVLNPQEV